MPQVIGGPPVRVRIQRLVRGGEAAGGDVGEEGGAGSLRSQFSALRGWRAAVMASSTCAISGGM